MSNDFSSPHRLLTVRQVAVKLSCSWRHVLRLADGGKMPRPLYLGRSVRWDESLIDQWIADGCPPFRVPNLGGDDE